MRASPLSPLAVLLAAFCACASTGRPSAEAPVQARFRAGFARAALTPPPHGWLSGYAHRTKAAEGAAQELWIRALALEDANGTRAVVVSADVLGIPPAMAGRLRAQAQTRLGLAPGALLLVATHTHSGPVLPERPAPEITFGLGKDELAAVDEFGRAFEARVLEAAAQALAHLAPARLAHARTRAAFGVNRRVWTPNKGEAIAGIRFGEDPERPHDPDVPVLWIEGEDGAPRAVLFSYACHPTTISEVDGKFHAYHGDFPGVAAARLEAALGTGAVALFVPGAAGDINPRGRGPLALAESNGLQLADLVLATARARGGAARSVSGPLRPAWTEIALPLRPAPERAELERLAGHPTELGRRYAAALLARSDPPPSEIRYPIAVWRFGAGPTLVALSGEATVEYALRLKRELGDDLWVAAYANEVMAYLPSERILAEGGYEAGWSRDRGPRVATGNMMFYGWPSPLAPGAEERVIAAVHALLGSRPPALADELRSALLFHAAFDGSPDADRAAGDRALYTAPEGKVADARRGLSAEGVSLSPAGKFGGALAFAGRVKDFVFFKGAGNVAYTKTAFAGTASFWLQVDPEGALGPGYSDPLEITDKKWDNACLFADFDREGSPRAFRFGVFPDFDSWNPGKRNWDDIPDEERPWVSVRRPPFAAGRWVHVVMTWSGYGGPGEGVAKLHLDGAYEGEQRGKRTFTWDPQKVLVALGKSFVGAIDDLAIFGRALDAREIAHLHALPGGVASLGSVVADRRKE